ncbi:MAG: hypothetical protein QF805_10100, partial [Pirellulaceae bacterium]|nr:hypothetical protein [Pirellulaceae bacterium]
MRIRAKYRQAIYSGAVLTFLLAAWSSGPVAYADGVLISPRINAKQMPQDFRVEAMKFTGPAGDGRRGSAGFVLQSREFVKDAGTKLSFAFERDVTGYGVQIIHPLAAGHVVVSIHSRGVTVHRGGPWGSIGWGDPATSDKVELNNGIDDVIKLQPGEPHQISSALSPDGS